MAARIHDLAPDLPLKFDIKALCRQLDIHEIREIDTSAYEAAIIMDEYKADGSILLARSSSAKRKRFSIGHELGHFLLPTHLPKSGGFSCSHGDLKTDGAGATNRHARIEAEANRFAAHLLMPPRKIRANLGTPRPDLTEVSRLSDEFFVSKEAMARSYVDAHRETLALVFLHHGKIKRFYKPDDFPFLDVIIGNEVPEDSVASDHGYHPAQASEMEECDPCIWLGEWSQRKVATLSEQVLAQRDGHAMVLLHAELLE
ncbi:ImmA/IrrE family metallo-endopeptidase [Qipengyuania mesophila]|uniref:ImmA/IrrE family metallo-endopeptidase n=1 Tax=Qipengyuania mesophila TaxID=2867246 RepID=UPI00355976A2